MGLSQDIDILKTKEAQDFIDSNINVSTQKLRLKYHGKTDLPYVFLINQIEARVRLKSKNPFWASQKNIAYPPKLNVEQSSSEATAKFKSKLFSGNRFVDLTGGMGIDCYFLNQNFKESHYCEENEDLSLLAKFNFNQLDTNIQVHSGNSFDFLKRSGEHFDLIYIDPARRIEGKRMVSLEDCKPNILEEIDFLLDKGNTIAIKTSPLLDIKKVTKELPFINEIYVLSVKNDCKELLFILKKEEHSNTHLHAINILKEKIEHTSSNEKAESLKFGMPQIYLYEPNASIMKSGLFNEVAHNQNIFKLHNHSHLYTSDKIIKDFPGKTFKIKDVFPPFKKSLKGEYYNIVCRNFKLKPEEIKKKAKTIDGGNNYIIATTLINDKPMFILTERVD